MKLQISTVLLQTGMEFLFIEIVPVHRELEFQIPTSLSYLLVLLYALSKISSVKIFKEYKKGIDKYRTEFVYQPEFVPNR